MSRNRPHPFMVDASSPGPQVCVLCCREEHEDCPESFYPAAPPESQEEK